MTATGTAAYDAWRDLPPAVAAAVDLARRTGFGMSCRPEQGELLRILARGAGPGMIGETGTGCGVGLAWLASAAHPDARIVSIERDAERATAVAHLLRDDPRVRVCHGGLIVIDDFTPSAQWPPMYGDQVDTARLCWLEHPAVRAAEIRPAADAATIVATVVGATSLD
jgi:hypothetical protein